MSQPEYTPRNGAQHLALRQEHQALMAVSAIGVPVKGADIRLQHRLSWGDAQRGGAECRQTSVRWRARMAPLGEAGDTPLVCDLQQLARLRVLDAHVEGVRAVAVDASERHLRLITPQDRKTWDNQDGAWTGHHPAPGQGPWAFSPEGTDMIEGRGQTLVRHRGLIEETVGEHQDGVRALAFLAGGQVAYSACGKQIKGWDLEARQALGVGLDTPAPVLLMASGPAGLLTIDSEGMLTRYDITRYRLQKMPLAQGPVTGASALIQGPDGEAVYALPAQGAVAITPAPGKGGQGRRITGLTGTLTALCLVNGQQGWRLYVAGSAGIQVMDWQRGVVLGHFCPLRAGGYLWSAGEWLADDGAATALVEVYQADGQGRLAGHDIDHEQRRCYLRDHTRWDKVCSTLYPWLRPDVQPDPRTRPIPPPFTRSLLLGWGG